MKIRMIGFQGRRRWRQNKLFKLCAKPTHRENRSGFNGLERLPEIFAARIRIQNLRFAHFLCAAQEMSGVIKR
jgi:hypothetical protein